MQPCSKLLLRHKAPGESRVQIKWESQASSQVSLQCLPAAPPDLLQATVSIDQMRASVAPIKRRFLWACSACQLVSASRRAT